MQQFGSNRSNSLSFYVLSDPLIVRSVSEAAIVFIWSLIGLGLAGFGVYRARRKK